MPFRARRPFAAALGTPRRAFPTACFTAAKPFRLVGSLQRLERAVFGEGGLPFLQQADRFERGGAICNLSARIRSSSGCSCGAKSVSCKSPVLRRVGRRAILGRPSPFKMLLLQAGRSPLRCCSLPAARPPNGPRGCRSSCRPGRARSCAGIPVARPTRAPRRSNSARRRANRPVGQLVIMGGEQRAAADGRGVLHDRPGQRHAVVGARAAADSSRITRLRTVARFRIFAVSVISTMNVLCPRAVRRPRRRGRNPIGRPITASRRHEAPDLAISVSSATWRMYVLLPAMFGPVMSRMAASSGSLGTGSPQLLGRPHCVSFGTNVPSAERIPAPDAGHR